jgi:hypothetical protein
MPRPYNPRFLNMNHPIFVELRITIPPLNRYLRKQRRREFARALITLIGGFRQRTSQQSQPKYDSDA